MLRRALVVLLLFVAACGSDETTSVERAADAAQQLPDVQLPTPLTTDPPASTSTVPPPTEGAVSEQGASPALPAPIEPVRAEPWTLDVYRGFGAWLDVFDWSVTFGPAPDRLVGPEHIDHMAAEGVETIYIQASRWNSPEDILEPERLQALIDRAHNHGMAVVAWYLPTMVDPETDLRRMLAMVAMDFDGFGVDIEARDVEDVAERNRRLLDLSARLEAALEGRPLAAIVMEPVIMEDVNAQFWPDYPWMGLAQHYDVWLPMSYWTNRRGQWRDAHTYTAENIARVRARIGQPDAPVHTIGGIGDKTTVDDLHGMVAAAVEQRAIGGSIYDYPTTDPSFWPVLRAFRSGPR